MDVFITVVWEILYVCALSIGVTALIILGLLLLAAIKNVVIDSLARFTYKLEAHRQSCVVARSPHAKEDQEFVDAISDMTKHELAKAREKNREN